MWSNYFKIAWRNMVRNKVYSSINILGLAIGLAVCMLIVLFVAHEKSFDSFHVNGNRIFRAETKIRLDKDSLFITNLDGEVAGAVATAEPFVDGYLRVREAGENSILENTEQSGVKFSEQRLLFSDSNFFSFFSFPLLRGNKDEVLKNPGSIVLSETAAIKYFGKEDPVGKHLRLNNSTDLTVTGIAKKPPTNSSIHFDFVARHLPVATASALTGGQQRREESYNTYFLLHAAGDGPRLEAGLLKLDKLKSGNGPVNSRFLAIPMKDLRLYADTADMTNTKYLKIFPLVAALILILALMNYVSLSTARSTLRAKEIGVRKVMGAGRATVGMQFFIESAIYTTLAFVLGYFFCYISQPVFFRYLEIDIDNSFLYYPYMLMIFGGLYLITLVLAATYPALLLSAFKPVLVLYGKFSKQRGGITVRKAFTVFQFGISVLLIICGIVIEKQIYLFKHADTGLNRENLLMIPFSAETGKHYAAYKKDLASLPGITETATALHPMFKGYDMMVTKPFKGDGMVLLPMLSVDQYFISMLGVKWKIPPAGNGFRDDRKTVIVNETALEKLQADANPLGQKIDSQYAISGVLRDFNWSSMQHKIEGLCLFIMQDNDPAALWAKNGGVLYARIPPNTNTGKVIQQIKEIHGKYDQQNPFEYYFMDEAYDNLYKSEERLSRIFMAFTGFTLLIAAMGLFGLATFMAVQRTKEIGVRKVLGASVSQLAAMLSGDFIRLVILSVLLASPVAWWFMHKWLEDFAYRTPISWWIFVASGSFVVLLALVTISFRAIKAGLANPVKSLRTE